MIDTTITTIWARLDVHEFRNLLWENLSLYSSLDKFYFDEFWMSCPFTFWELYKNLVEPTIM